ncbi:MAG: hypothetical protein ACKPKO_03380, partial [Candidatus Fonsibacter sp.]
KEPLPVGSNLHLSVQPVGREYEPTIIFPLVLSRLSTNGTSLYIKKDSIHIQASSAMNMIDLSPTQTILYNKGVCG